MSDELLRRNVEIDAEMAQTDTGQALLDLAAYGRENRRRIWALRWVAMGTALGLVADLVLSAILIFNVFEVRRNAASISNICETERNLWAPVIENSRKHPNPNLTPEQRENQEEVTRRFVKSLEECGKP